MTERAGMINQPTTNVTTSPHIKIYGDTRKSCGDRHTEKDVHSSFSARTPKSQLAVEQPFTGTCWNTTKDTPCPRTKENKVNDLT